MARAPASCGQRELLRGPGAAAHPWCATAASGCGPDHDTRRHRPFGHVDPISVGGAGWVHRIRVARPCRIHRSMAQRAGPPDSGGAGPALTPGAASGRRLVPRVVGDTAAPPLPRVRRKELGTARGTWMAGSGRGWPARAGSGAPPRKVSAIVHGITLEAAGRTGPGAQGWDGWDREG